MNTQRTLNRIGIALLIASVAGSTIAAEPNTKDADLLRGPKVAESSSVQSNDTMGGPAKARKKAGELPFRAFVNAVHRLRVAAKDNPELALTEEQREQIKSIDKAHKESMRAFMEEHRDELIELNRYKPERAQEGAKGQRRGQQDKKRGDEQGKERGNHRDKDAKQGARQAPSAQSDAPEEGTLQAELDARPPLSRREMKQNREKLAKLMQLAPSDAEPKKQIWAVLTPEQQTAVKKNIQRVQKQRSQQSNMMLGRGGKKAKPDAQKVEQKKKPQRGKRIKEDTDD